MRTETVRKSISRQQALIITLAGVVIVYLLWNVDFLSGVAYPLRLFVTYIHEAGHGLAAILTGGEIIQFTVSPNGSGLATTAGGSRLVILPAGYLGATLFGSVLFYLINRHPNWARGLAVVLGIALIIFTVLYARPDDGGAPTALLVGLAIGAGLTAIGLRLSIRTNLLVLSVLAIMTSLHAVLDITWLVRYADVCNTRVCNDAYAFHEAVGGIIPAAFWALLWAAITIVITWTAVYYSVLRPLLRGDKRQPLRPEADNSSAEEQHRTRKSADPLAGIKRDKDGEIDWS
ncbi:MAG: M50 family metallopeptidase [Chloroflexota bacterium]